MSIEHIRTFDDLALEIALQTRQLNTQSKIISHYRAKTYSLSRRNRMLVHYNRAYLLLVCVLLLFIFIKYVVGVG